MGGNNHGCCDTCKLNVSRLIYEFFGTLLLTMVFLTHGAGPGKVLMAVWILTVFCWKVSGSHFNPIISFAYIFRKDTSGLPRLVMILYMLVQVLGAFFGALLMVWLQEDLAPIGPSNQTTITPNHHTHANCYLPNDGKANVNVFRASMQETIGSFIFVFFFMT